MSIQKLINDLKYVKDHGDSHRWTLIGQALAELLQRPAGRSLTDIGTIDTLNVKIIRLEAQLQVAKEALGRINWSNSPAESANRSLAAEALRKIGKIE